MQIDLLLTDVVMPGMGGAELAHRLTELRPGTRILYMSGYPGDALVGDHLRTAGGSFLPKPFTAEVLAGQVRQLLDGKA